MTVRVRLAVVLVTLGLFHTVTLAALPHEAYVWQREWRPEVSAAVRERGRSFTQLVPLAAELSWRGSAPELARVQIDYAALKAAAVPVGLALRIGPCPNTVMRDNATAAHIAELAAAILRAARAEQLQPTELQLDFDCAESKLDLYREWVMAIRAKITPTPLVITVLPAWLRRAEFPALASATDGLVLQVHSLELPKDPNTPFSLCDPAGAQAAVKKLDALGVPFRVALPTYGYLLAFSAQGNFLGLSADGSPKVWPEDARLVETRADASAIAGLVREWTAKPPKNLTGFIWYRLPVGREAMNWPWETLEAVMQGRAPRAALQIRVRQTDNGLVELEVANVGEADLPAAEIETKWTDARLLAGDALNGYELVEVHPGMAQLRPAAGTTVRIAPGQTCLIGWLRLDKEAEVTVREIAQ